MLQALLGVAIVLNPPSGATVVLATATLPAVTAMMAVLVAPNMKVVVPFECVPFDGP